MKTDAVKYVKFTRSFLGYNMKDVDEVLDKVLDSLAENEREAKKLEEENNSLKQEKEKLQEEIEKNRQELEKHKQEIKNLKQELEKELTINRESFDKVDRFKVYFGDLYRKQMDLLTMLPSSNDIGSRDRQAVEVEIVE